MSIKRKVSFYYLSANEYIENYEKRTVQEKELTLHDIEGIFLDIFDTKMHLLANNHKAINVTTKSNKYVIEVFYYKNSMSFLRIGQQNDANTVALRDQNTLESENVPMKDGQLLELFTYALIDFKTGIVSYIGINGAPKISAIQSLFSLYDERKIVASVSSIMTDDILNTISRKRIISKILLTVSIPKDDILSDIGISATDFDDLRNVKTSTITYNIVAQRNKNVFSSSNHIAEWFGEIKTKFGDCLKGLSVNAKDENEESQTYDLLEHSFTKTVYLSEENSSKLTENDFEKSLKRVYSSNQTELLRYIR